MITCTVAGHELAQVPTGSSPQRPGTSVNRHDANLDIPRQYGLLPGR